MRWHISKRYQIPVGFGGFHVAMLGEPWSPPWHPFVIVYDCGSLAQLLASEWATRVGQVLAERGERVDLAVLSHTDFDHVCGIEALARSVDIETLMLPWLEVPFREAQAAQARRRPSWYRRFVLDPVAWATARRVSRVVFVADAGPEDGTPAPEAPGRVPPERAGGLSASPDGRRYTRPVLTFGRTSRAAPSGDPETIVSSGDPLAVRTVHPDLGWLVIPIVAPPTKPLELENALAAALSGRDRTAIFAGLSMKKKESLRNDLARIYRRHWSNTNRSSVMLLVVPFDGDGGWLCTGDADLTDPAAQQRLRQHGARFARVDAIHVPHHGSPHNLDAAAITFLQTLGSGRPVRWVVSAGKNKWGYPSKAVERACGQLEGPRQASSLWSDIVCF